MLLDVSLMFFGREMAGEIGTTDMGMTPTGDFSPLP
jgi:hypothetical protein